MQPSPSETSGTGSPESAPTPASGDPVGENVTERANSSPRGSPGVHEQMVGTHVKRGLDFRRAVGTPLRVVVALNLGPVARRAKIENGIEALRLGVKNARLLEVEGVDSVRTYSAARALGARRVIGQGAEQTVGPSFERLGASTLISGPAVCAWSVAPAQRGGHSRRGAERVDRRQSVGEGFAVAGGRVDDVGYEATSSEDVVDRAAVEQCHEVALAVENT